MTIPTTTLFDILDWNSRSAATADTGDATIQDIDHGAQQADIVDESQHTSARTSFARGGLRLHADATRRLLVHPLLSTWRFPFVVGQTYTFEFDVAVFGDLPDNFSDIDKRIYVGCVNRTGYTAGVLFSKQGIALAPSPAADDRNIVILQGSWRYFLTADKKWRREVDNSYVVITIRIVVRGEDGRAEVYITDENVAYEDETAVYGAHQLRYTIPAVPSSLNMDQVLLALRSISKAAEPSNYDMAVSSLRIASYVVDSPSKPVAVAPIINRVAVGRRVRLDGRKSYDVAGGTLNFEWNVVERPLGSTSKLRGGIASSGQLGSVAGDNIINLELKEESSLLDGFLLEVIAHTTAEPLKITKHSPDRATIILETGSQGTVVTKASDLVRALSFSSHPAHNAEVSALLTASLATESLGLGSVVPENVTLIGGVGSLDDATVFLADVPGHYRFSLRVYTDTLYSDPVIFSILAAKDDQLLRHRPNTDYIWKSLSDFWNMVDDKAQIEVAWSAAAQIISNELLQLWQRDYAKSLATITRRFQRRWLEYRLHIDLPESMQDAVVMAPGVVAYAKPTAETLTADPLTSTVFNTTTTAGTLVDPITEADLLRDPGFSAGLPVVIINEGGQVVSTRLSSITVGVTSTAFSLTTSAMNSLRTAASGKFGVFTQDPAGGALLLFEVAREPLRPQDLKVGDTLIVALDDSYVTYVVSDLAPLDTSAAEDVIIPNTIGLTGSTPVYDGANRQWSVVRPVGVAQVHQQPYFSFKSFVDLRPSEFQFADAILVQFPSPFMGDALEIQVPILHTTAREIFPDWRVLISELNTLSALTPSDMGGGTVYSFSNLGGVIARSIVLAVIRTERIPLIDDVESIPILGSTTTYAELTENRDYTVDRGAINILPTNEFTAKVVAGSDRLLLTAPLTDTGISGVVITEGDIGYYGVVSVSVDAKTIQVGHTFQRSGTFKGRTPRYAATAVLPHRLWSEVTYFKNDDLISDNFGMLVGLPRNVVEASGVDLDYLSIVKSTWVALMQGPQVSSLKLAAESFLGLPYVEEGGVITVWADTDTPTTGRIVIKTPNQGGYRTYYYPSTYKRGTHPTTGRTLKSATLTQAKEWSRTEEEQLRLTALIADSSVPEEEIQYIDGIPVVIRVKDGYRKELANAQRVDDATVSAYTPLLSAVEVYDYVSNLDRVNQMLTGSDVLTRVHTFVVELPAQSLGNQDYVPLFKDFVDLWKPSRTDILLLGVYPVVDEIDVTDAQDYEVTLSLADTPHSSPVIKSSSTSTAENQTPISFPSFATDDRGWLALDRFDKYESGYVEGRVSDWSGDGSWNHPRSAVDMVNTADSDVDVLASYLWIPILKISTGDEFVWGEELELWDNTLVQSLTGYGWDATAFSGSRLVQSSAVIQDTNTLLLPAQEPQESRTYLRIENHDATDDLYVTVDGTDPTLPGHLIIAAGEHWSPSAMPTGEIRVANQAGSSGFVAFAVDSIPNYPAGAPPVIEHIGSGQHPCLPFGINNPQDKHPYTYLLVGFYKADGSINYGHETRLRALQRFMHQYIHVRGKTSGAIGRVLGIRGGTTQEYPYFEGAKEPTNGSYDLHRLYYQLAHYFSADKAHYWGPHIHTSLQPTQYLPVGGMTIANMRTHGSDTSEFGAIFDDMQVQCFPYDPTLPNNAQLVPSFTGGFFTGWDDLTPATDEVEWGWKEEGLLTSGSPISAFDSDTAVSGSLENVHTGKRVRAWRENHKHHGWSRFVIPSPIVFSVDDQSNPGTVRIEGYYFVNYDTTQSAIPGSTAATFTGTIGGCWVFLKHTGTLDEYPAASVVFETGTVSGRTVLGLDGATQDSAGHVLEIPVPVGLPYGSYDVIVRNYRPHVFNSGDPVTYCMDEYVYPDGYQSIDTQGFGGDGFGDDGFGG